MSPQMPTLGCWVVASAELRVRPKIWSGRAGQVRYISGFYEGRAPWVYYLRGIHGSWAVGVIRVANGDEDGYIASRLGIGVEEELCCRPPSLPDLHLVLVK